MHGSRKIHRKQVFCKKTHLRKFHLLGEIAVFCTPSIYPPPCTLPSTVHSPTHLHTGPSPLLYTVFRLLVEISRGKFSYSKLVYGKFSGHEMHMVIWKSTKSRILKMTSTFFGISNSDTKFGFDMTLI